VLPGALPGARRNWRREAGELQRTGDTVLRFTGAAPLALEDYFRSFPELLRALGAAGQKSV
jgi:hypothetical protein